MNYFLNGLSGKVKFPDCDELEDDLPSDLSVIISAEPLLVADFDRNLLLLRLGILLLSRFWGLGVGCLSPIFVGFVGFSGTVFG